MRCGVTTSSERLLPAGTVLQGKWNGNCYELQKLLGQGSNGQVYLAVQNGRQQCAIKLGCEAADLQAEVNRLISLDAALSNRPAFLLDVDDARIEGREAPFYMMRYVAGQSVYLFLQRYGEQWLSVIGCQLLDRLSELHRAGWIFGDIKSENVLVAQYGRVELVDYGGMSEIGRSVRQFTEIYDRGYWSAGGRSADPGYDLFSVAVLWLHVLDSRRLRKLTNTLLPQNRHPDELLKLVYSHPLLQNVAEWMEKALTGRFSDTEEACRLWRQQFGRGRGVKRYGGKVPAWMTGMLTTSVALSLLLIYLWQHNS